MKYLFGLLFVVIVSTSVFAGDYFESRIDTYDPITGLYYKAVEDSHGEGGLLSSKTSGSVVVNIAIFDPIKETSSLLFKEPQKGGILIVLFETGYKEGVIEFNGVTHSSLVLNNTHVGKRDPRNKLLIAVRSKESKDTILFVSDKRGGELKKLVTVPLTADWHIDEKNSKLRVVHQTGKGIRVESYVW
ncbi:MAG: hypothetical protein ACLPSL_02940 [Smithella sp.]